MKPNVIGGEYRAATDVTLNHNPSDLADTVGEFADASPQDVRDAVDAGRAAASSWFALGRESRAAVLSRTSAILASEADSLGALLSRELGKPLKEATGEVARAASVFEFYAGEASRSSGRLLHGESEPAPTIESFREPLGVIGLITPWNFPIAIPAWKTAAALAYGNVVVLKPAELTPASAWELVRILHQAGAPDGVVNLVMGPGHSTGKALLEERLDAISFTGSTAVGRMVSQTAAAAGTRVQCEMGGKNPTVVCADADLDVAVNCVLDAAFFSAGQRCTATSRVIVEEPICNQFLQLLVEKTRRLTVGNALDPETVIGPVASRAQLDRNLEFVAIGLDEGANLETGGQRLSRKSDGYYFEPTVFSDAHNAMRLCREEIFGPILATICARDYDEALALANDSDFGLSAAVCTTSLKRARHFIRNVQAGTVSVNRPSAGIDHRFPFGGFKSSGYGSPELGSEAAEFFTRTKTVYISG